MAAQMTPEQNQEFGAIVDIYLRSSDLSTVTARKVRNHLQESVGYDLSHLKAAVKELIQERFDNILAEQAAATTNGASSAEPPIANGDDDVNNDFSFAASDSASHPSNKRKHQPGELNTDAKLAVKLHQELNVARSSRSSATSSQRSKSTSAKNRAPPKAKKSKASTVEDSDGSADGTGGQPEKKKRAINRSNPFNALMQLSEPLSNLIGKTECSRPECVKHIWAYVKQNGLQDPDDKRFIICDDTMKKVFNNANRVHMFTMNKVLSNHLYPIIAMPKTEPEA